MSTTAYFRCVIQQEAIAFITIWQTSASLNEVFQRLESSEVWAGRVERLGERYAPWSSCAGRGQWRKAKHKHSGVDMTTRGLAKRFYAQLVYQKGISTLTPWCHMTYHCQGDALDLNKLAEQLAAGVFQGIDTSQLAC